MIRFEVKNLLQRRGLLFVMIAALIMGLALSVRGAYTANGSGASLAAVDALYATLPDEREALSDTVTALEERYAYDFGEQADAYRQLCARVREALDYRATLESRQAQTRLKLLCGIAGTPGSFSYRSLWASLCCPRRRAPTRC